MAWEVEAHYLPPSFPILRRSKIADKLELERCVHVARKSNLKQGLPGVAQDVAYDGLTCVASDLR